MSDTELKPCPKCGSTSVKHFVYDDGYGVFCRRCQFELYPHKLEKVAAEEWNAMPRPLQWTSEPPTEPGWYWYRLNERDNISITYVDVYGTVITYYPNLCPDGWSRQNLKNIHGQWAGPIPEPMEAQEAQ